MKELFPFLKIRNLFVINRIALILFVFMGMWVHAQNETIIHTIHKDTNIICGIADEFSESIDICTGYSYNSYISFLNIKEPYREIVIKSVFIYPKQNDLGTYLKNKWSMLQSSPFGVTDLRKREVRSLPIHCFPADTTEIEFDIKAEYYLTDKPKNVFLIEGSFKSKTRNAVKRINAEREDKLLEVFQVDPNVMHNDVPVKTKIKDGAVFTKDDKAGFSPSFGFKVFSDCPSQIEEIVATVTRNPQSIQGQMGTQVHGFSNSRSVVSRTIVLETYNGVPLTLCDNEIEVVAKLKTGRMKKIKFVVHYQRTVPENDHIIRAKSYLTAKGAGGQKKYSVIDTKWEIDTKTKKYSSNRTIKNESDTGIWIKVHFDRSMNYYAIINNQQLKRIELPEEGVVYSEQTKIGRHLLSPGAEIKITEYLESCQSAAYIGRGIEGSVNETDYLQYPIFTIGGSVTNADSAETLTPEMEEKLLEVYQTDMNLMTGSKETRKKN